MPEHLRNVRLSWIGFGWFVAVALTALALLALDSFGVVRVDGSFEAQWVALALVFGFTLAGFLVGTRINAAPVLHGLGIGAFSVAGWLVLNLVSRGYTGATAWDDLASWDVFVLLALQLSAAIVGVRLGVRWIRS